MMQFRTRTIHVGNEPCAQTGAVVPPIHLATTFVQPGAGEWGEFDYSRSGNPTRKSFETTLASLEGGVGAASRDATRKGDRHVGPPKRRGTLFTNGRFRAPLHGLPVSHLKAIPA